MKKRRLALRGVLLLAVTAALVADSRFRLQVTEYELLFDSLPPALDGYRIVQLSDLHGAVFGPENRSLARAVERQQPDLIALTGDFVGAPDQLRATEELLYALEGTAPIAWVSGNHEWASACLPKLREILDRYGVIRLENRYLPLPWRGSRLILAGVEDPNGRADMIKPDALAAQLREEYPTDFVLWLGHRNDWVEKYPALPVDLILSGHAHGGVVRLPFVGGLLNTDRRLFAKYEAGVYESGSYKMLVSRGLGNSIPIPRFLNRPELVVVTLRSGQA